ncbi:hypothetical protein PIB30_000163 [Stylosanthes scabra]|uniref:Uncharacterized protein n=1 Tax=Stylosanthes scabra TaxID=79078 RepID=A0ABU6R3N0_9FABA|nr:hypothetical protein [Stylosanthes scabra]
MISDIMLEGGSGYKPDTQFDGSQVPSGPERACVRFIAYVHGSWWDSSISSTCAGWILGGTVSWRLPVCRLLQRHLHRLSRQTSQQHVSRPAELLVVEGAAPEAIWYHGSLKLC